MLLESSSSILSACVGRKILSDSAHSFWQWPNIKGLQDFKGIIAHSASYPDNLDLRGKRIAIVGTGASGIQLTAALQKDASHMYTWIRTPTWITSGFASTHAGPDGGNFECEFSRSRLIVILGDD
jgi:hypothetical protein